MTKNRNDDSRNDLDTRLRMFYGPSLPAQPLTSQSWDVLSRQLKLQKRTPNRRTWHGVRGLRRSMMPGKALPPFVQESLARVMNEARWQQRVPPLSCSIKSHAYEPSLHLATMLLLGKPTIYLTLPIDAPISMERVEIDVLLATGLARSLLMNRIAVRMLRYVYACLLLYSYCFTVYSVVHRQLFEFLIAIGISVIVTATWQYQKRKQAYKADTITVYWLGRNRMCEGLHILASHKSRHRQWRLSEPSLEKRIERVCGTRVLSRNKDLTLVG